MREEDQTVSTYPSFLTWLGALGCRAGEVGGVVPGVRARRNKLDTHPPPKLSSICKHTGSTVYLPYGAPAACLQGNAAPTSKTGFKHTKGSKECLLIRTKTQYAHFRGNPLCQATK